MSVYWGNNGTNLTVNSVANNTVKATIGRTTGKYYWEIYIDNINGTLIGIANSSVPLTGSNFANVSCRWYYYTGEKTPPRVNYRSSFTTGDTIGVFLDLDNKIIEFFKNGISQGVAFTDLSSLGEVYPAISSGASVRTQTITANFGASEFTHVPTSLPSGTLSYDGSQNLKVLNKTLILHDGEYKKWNEKIVDKQYTSYIPQITSNTNEVGEASASSYLTSSDTQAWQAFNSDIGLGSTKSWVTAQTTGWLQFKFNEPKNVTFYRIGSVQGSETMNPKNWTLEASNNGVDWDILSTVTNAIPSNSAISYYELNNTKSYYYYRLNITQNNGHTTRLGVSYLFLGDVHTEIFPNHWSTISDSEVLIEQFLSDGMESLSPLLDRRVETLEPLPMTNKSEILFNNGKLFSKTIDLKKYMDIRSINVEVK